MPNVQVVFALFVLCLLPPCAGAKNVDAASAAAGDQVSLLQGQVEMKRSEANEAKRAAAPEKNTYSAGFSCPSSASCGDGEGPATFHVSFPAAVASSEEGTPHLEEGARAEAAIGPQAEPGEPEGEAESSTSVLGVVLQVLACVLIADVLRRHGSKRQAAGKAAGCCAAKGDTLLDAALAGDEAGFEAALAGAGAAELQQVDRLGCTALHYAAKGGSAPVVRRLLGLDVRLEAVDAWDETPLHLAARAGHLEVCEALLAAGACIDAPNAEEYTPLVVAGQADQAAVCKYLIERGAGVAGLDKQEVPSLVAELQAQQHDE